jgi:hypothetical protein
LPRGANLGRITGAGRALVLQLDYRLIGQCDRKAHYDDRLFSVGQERSTSFLESDPAKRGFFFQLSAE